MARRGEVIDLMHFGLWKTTSVPQLCTDVDVKGRRTIAAEYGPRYISFPD
jgi:hypothetical protein